MKSQKINKMFWYLILGLSLVFNSLISYANDNYKFSLGVKILGTEWNGKNETSNTEYDETVRGQLGFNIGLQKGNFYTGLSLQNGEYSFKDDGPDQVSSNSTVTVTDVKVSRTDIDLVAGYYIWENVSFFVDFKSILNDHNKNNYTQEFAGLGFGVTGVLPYNEEVTFYGSFGFVPDADVEAGNDIGMAMSSVGTASSGAFEVGASFRIAESHSLNAGLKVQAQRYKFNNGNIQIHGVSGIFVGYNYLFSVD